MTDLHKSVGLHELMDLYFGQYTGKQQFTNALVRILWKQTFPEVVVRYTKKIYCHKNALFIHIGSPALRSELEFKKKEILEQFNNHPRLAFIQDVVFL